MDEMKFETYTFSYSDEDNVVTTLTFTVPAVGTHIATLHDMCVKFAQACGYANKSIEEYFGDNWDESFEEFMR